VLRILFKNGRLQRESPANRDSSALSTTDPGPWGRDFGRFADHRPRCARATRRSRSVGSFCAAACYALCDMRAYPNHWRRTVGGVGWMGSTNWSHHRRDSTARTPDSSAAINTAGLYDSSGQLRAGWRCWWIVTRIDFPPFGLKCYATLRGAGRCSSSMRRTGS
jgi:hypothetical protein